jgi:hypothetical protein
MKKDSIRLENVGTYLFRSPAKVSVQVNHELLVVLTVPFARACGQVLIDINTQPKEFHKLLNTLLERMVADLKIRPQQIRAKVFGMSHFRKSLGTALDEWAKQNEVLIAVRDLGRGTTRSILIKCDDGLVGVTYADRIEMNAPAFLTLGSAKARVKEEKISQTEHRVLILSMNKVRKLLAKQAVEEHAGFEASFPKDAHQFLVKKPGKNFPYSHVLIFDDLENSPTLKTFVKQASAHLPLSSFSWIGENLPGWASNSRLMPPLEPQTISAFKKSLHVALFTPAVSVEPTSTVLSFEKRKKLG